LRFPREKKTIHVTQKPVALFEYLIKSYSRKGETILDACLGGGTTCIAAMNTNRSFVGFEKDFIFFNKIKRRINDHLKKTEQALKKGA
jgi:site-specific DNA-methyltransferase (adenine-specific)